MFREVNCASLESGLRGLFNPGRTVWYSTRSRVIEDSYPCISRTCTIRTRDSVIDKTLSAQLFLVIAVIVISSSFGKLLFAHDGIT